MSSKKKPLTSEQKARITDCNKRYRERNRQLINTRSKAYKERLKTDYTRLLKSYMWAKFKREAKKRKKEHKLKYEEYAATVIQPCWYCGELGTPYVGIDRIDNSKGYEDGNVAPCCTICNLMKHKQDVNEFILRCKTISDRFFLNNN